VARLPALVALVRAARPSVAAPASATVPGGVALAGVARTEAAAEATSITPVLASVAPTAAVFASPAVVSAAVGRAVAAARLVGGHVRPDAAPADLAAVHAPGGVPGVLAVAVLDEGKARGVAGEPYAVHAAVLGARVLHLLLGRV